MTTFGSEPAPGLTHVDLPPTFDIFSTFDNYGIRNRFKVQQQVQKCIMSQRDEKMDTGYYEEGESDGDFEEYIEEDQDGEQDSAEKKYKGQRRSCAARKVSCCMGRKKAIADSKLTCK